MKVKLILPALTEATSPPWRPIKYSLFPPLARMTAEELERGYWRAYREFYRCGDRSRAAPRHMAAW